jgi:hypothetical protein
MIQGFSSFGSWYDEGMKVVERDIQAGTDISEFTRRQRDFLNHLWDQKQLEEHIEMLHKEQITPLSHIQIEKH